MTSPLDAAQKVRVKSDRALAVERGHARHCAKFSLPSKVAITSFTSTLGKSAGIFVYAKMYTYFAVLAGGLICLVLRVIHIALYGPLASYPGPLICSFTRLPFIWHGLRGQLPFWIKSLHDIYGQVVRVAPDELSFSDHRAWQEIYGSKRPELEKDLRAYGSGKSRMQELVMADSITHSRLRRALVQGFSTGAIKSYTELLSEHSDQLISRISSLTEGGKTVVDLDQLYAMLAFDVAGDLILGENPHLLACGDDCSGRLKNMWMHIKMLDIFVPTQYHWFGSLLRLWLISPAMKIASKLHHTWMIGLIDKRISGESRQDVWEPILKHSKNSLSDDEVHANVQLLMLGATETTATTLSALTYFIFTNPGVLKCLNKEIRDSFDLSEKIDVESVTRLPYLNACIDEALRILPPIPSGLPRVVHSGGASICGKFVPSGTTVTVYPFAMHRDERNFYEAETFRPERWLDAKEFADDRRAASQPFLVGSRNCLGRGLALAEIRCIMAKLLWHFDLHICDESRDWAADRKMFIFWDKKPLFVRAVARHGE